MSRQDKASKHLGKGSAKRHDHHHKNEKYNYHKLGVVMTHNKHQRDHSGESASK